MKSLYMLNLLFLSLILSSNAVSQVHLSYAETRMVQEIFKAENKLVQQYIVEEGWGNIKDATWI